jgi:integrase
MKKMGKNLELIAENEDEEKYLAELQKIIINAIKRDAKSKDIIIGILQGDELKRLTLGAYTEKFMEYKKRTDVTGGTVSKYSKTIEFLIMFFGAKKNLRHINASDVYDFRDFLFQIPVNYQNDDFLKNKNIALLIKKKSKFLDKYEVLHNNTVLEYMKKAAHIFNHFQVNSYVYKNYFANYNEDNMLKEKKSSTKEFKKSQLKRIFAYARANNEREAYNFIKFTLLTGLRRAETLGLTVEDVDLDYDLIRVNGTKNDFADRLMVIHKDLLPLLVEQSEGKEEDDDLFFANYSSLNTREEKVGTEINNLFSCVIGAEEKPYLNIRSLRKNLAQELKKPSIFDILDIDAIMAHSNDQKTLKKYYLRMETNYKRLNEQIDMIDFSEYFE